MRKFFVLLLTLVLLVSCSSVRNGSDYDNYAYGRADELPNKANVQKAPAKVDSKFDASDMRSVVNAAIALGFDIDYDDDIPLFMEAASWIGTPYRAAGNDHRGVDCSGLSTAIYRNVYGILLERSSEGQFVKNCHKISKNSLRQGDLVFFAINSTKTISHVGIFLKDGMFIHASSTRGVVVNSLEEDYYRKYYYASGRVK